MKLFIVHHYASRQDPESAWRRFNTKNDRSVSPNYQVNADGRVFEVVPPDHWRAWTTGSVDHQAVTCETQNISTAPDWGISAASREAIAHLIVWASRRYGFPIQRGRVTGTSSHSVVEVPGIVGHNETPAGRRTSTACPGPSMNVAGLIERARQIAGQSKPPAKPAAPAAPVQKEEDDMDKAVIYHRRDADGKVTWALVGATVPTGVRITHSQDTANAWARIYGASKGEVKSLNEWETLFREAKALNDSWLEQMRSILTSATS